MLPAQSARVRRYHAYGAAALRPAVLVVVLLVLLLLALATYMAQRPTPASASAVPRLPFAATPTTCAYSWDDLFVPHHATQNSTLNAIAVLSPTDIWTGGSEDGSASVHHFDGEEWTTYWATDVFTQSVIKDMAAVTSDDVWAVGWKYDYGDTRFHGRVLHWNGAEWAAVDTPAWDGAEKLYGVEALSANDVWAVGVDNLGMDGFAMHFDGQAWTVTPMPQGSTQYMGLESVSAAAPDDVWAVSDKVIHWDGTAWSVAFEPPPGGTYRFFDVLALQSGDVWAAGGRLDGGSINTGIVYHRTGSTWTEVVSEANSVLFAVDGLSGSDMWAVGWQDSTSGILLKHWDGTSWGSIGGPAPVSDSEPSRIVAMSPDTVLFAHNTTNPSWQTTGFLMRYTRECPPPVICQPGWNAVSSPNPDPSVNMLYGVDATSPNDVWAVGAGSTGPLLEHWNGSTWAASVYTDLNRLITMYGVWANTPSDVWAVGHYYSDARRIAEGRRRLPQGAPDWNGVTVALHWNGAEWQRVTTPNPGIIGGGSRLNAVSGVSENDAWAVGTYTGANGTDQAFLLHWDGTVWTHVPAVAGQLYGVTALAADNVWVVGQSQIATLVLHWDGTSWTQVPSPSPGTLENLLLSVSALGPNDIWASGWANGGPEGTGPMTLHWDGTVWTRVPVPGGAQVGAVVGLSAVSHNDVWGVFDLTVDNVPRAIHWNGTAWTLITLPHVGNGMNPMGGIAAVSPNEVWVTGFANWWDNSRTLIERYVTSCGALTPTPTLPPTFTPTRTATLPSTATQPPQATSTATVAATSTAQATQPPQATNTATATTVATATSTPVVATPTACTLQFADVPPGSTFYTYVRCLACEGIVAGYPCGGPGEPCNGTSDPYFRPNGGVTRGQIAKIVALAANMQYPAFGQSFADVPPGSTFYVYAQQMQQAGAMSGYPCGGAPTEPCIGPENLPYFRPNNGATRGQLAKIVAVAGQFGGGTPYNPTFADVPRGSTFFEYVEILLLNRPGVMQGYPCGGPGEPCDPQDRPYFRPANPVTRGQTSKIVTNALLPTCTP